MLSSFSVIVPNFLLNIKFTQLQWHQISNHFVAVILALLHFIRSWTQVV